MVIKRLLKAVGIIIGVLSQATFAFLSPIVGIEDVKKSQDSIQLNIDNLETYVRNNLFSSGSKPVMFTGEARIKIIDTKFDDSIHAPYMGLDLHNLMAGWEGNESAIRLGMIVRPNGNVIMWSKLGFNTTFTGYYNKDFLTNLWNATDPYFTYQIHHDKDNNPIFIQEDMSAGIAIRYPSFSMWARMGNVLWVQASPLTIWKAQPRTFAWDYLPFEIEQPIAKYYEYNIVKGIKEGRAAWNKKPFQGIQFESINLPWGLYFNAIMAKFENYDNMEPNYVDFATDRGLAETNLTELKGLIKNYPYYYKSTGINDTYRWMYHLRLSKSFSKGEWGFNYVGIRYDQSYIYLGLTRNYLNSPGQPPKSAFFYDSSLAYYKNVDVVSTDYKGSLKDIDVHFDFAVSKVDTQYFAGIKDSSGKKYIGAQLTNKVSGSAPGFYANLKYKTFVIPFGIEFIYVPKYFYSPFSFVAPHECMIPYGANLLGAGKFVARGEASPYVSNMTGLNITLDPKINDGHARLNIGYHGQIENGLDAIYFPYILNGATLQTSIQSTYTRWGNGLVDEPDILGFAPFGTVPYSVTREDYVYRNRLGVLPYYYTRLKGIGDVGGLIIDYLGAYEGFVAFDDSTTAYNTNFIRNYTPDSLSQYDIFHKKSTQNITLDIAINLSNYIGLTKPLYLGMFYGYFSIANKTGQFIPIFDKNNENLVLSGSLIRFEPAFGLTKQFYILGVLGIEKWYSYKAWAAVDQTTGEVISSSLYTTGYYPITVSVERKPIDFTDKLLGIGFDWDFAPRVGFHFRASTFSHDDKEIPINNYEGRMLSGELKMYF